MTTPALVIGHSSDRLHPLGDAARLSAQLPDARFGRGPLDPRAAAPARAAHLRDRRLPATTSGTTGHARPLAERRATREDDAAAR